MAYSQNGNQAQGCGFPFAQAVVFFCLVTGAVAGACVAAKTTSEIEMSRLLYQDFSVEDVAMADQLCDSYVDLALNELPRRKRTGYQTQKSAS